MQEKGGGLHILDALENLTTLVDVDSLGEIEVTEDALLIPHRGESEEQLLGEEDYWVQAGSDKQTLAAIKETFRSVHAYLQAFYFKMKKQGETRRLIEGINTIMVLVGEAAKNFDRFGSLFKERISEFEEYKKLQNFYQNRVIKETFKEFAKAPLIQEKRIVKENFPEQSEEEVAAVSIMLPDEEVEEISGVHILNDLEVIKKDHHYELFYLKNEAGYPFYTFALARTIKLACDFGEFAQEYFGDDPLLQIKNWEDKILNLRADRLRKRCGSALEKFYREAMPYKELPMVKFFHKALMALMLTANPRNLIRQFSLKGCHLYFHDFLVFLRETLNNRDYQKFLIYPSSGQPCFHSLSNLVYQLCYQLFTMETLDEELQWALKKTIARTQHKKSVLLSQNLIEAHLALTEVLKQHPNGPVFKVLDILRDQEEQHFDPLFQGNLPGKEWTLYQGEKEILCLRIPCPVTQAVIHRAQVTLEFKTFLGALSPKEHLLFINYQNRTSWEEHARSLALEELARQAEFAEQITVVTLAKDTDFYNQAGHYQTMHEVEIFIDHFYQHLSDEITGYYFPVKLKKELFESFMKELLHQIHATFFDKKEQLTFSERLDFIQIAYHFIELKLLELVQPSMLSLSSKDGLDMSGAATIGLMALVAISHEKKWSEQELDRLNTLLFGPTLMQRERIIHSERFQRLASMIQLLESKGNYLKAFEALFEKESLNLSL